MSAQTSRLKLTKPGGGSHGTITPGDPVDIDVLNDNADILDSAVGAQSFTSATRPAAPYNGQLIYETDTRGIARFDGSAWSYPGPAAVTLLPSTFNFATNYSAGGDTHLYQVGNLVTGTLHVISSGAMATGTIVTLPVGARPAQSVVGQIGYLTGNNSYGSFTIGTDGTVVYNGDVTGTGSHTQVRIPINFVRA